MSDGWAMHTRARRSSSSLSLSQPPPHDHQPLQPPLSLNGDASSDADTEANSEKPSQPSQPSQPAAAGEQAAAAAAAPSARLLRRGSTATVVDYSSTAAFELPDCQLLIADAPTQCNIEDPLSGSGRGGGSKAHKIKRAAPTNSQPLSSATATAAPHQPRPLLSLRSAHALSHVCFSFVRFVF